MLIWRRRTYPISLVLVFALVQLLIYKLYFFECDCDNNIPPLSSENVNDTVNIVNLNTRILCWVPTTLSRLDRAAVAYE